MSGEGTSGALRRMKDALAWRRGDPFEGLGASRAGSAGWMGQWVEDCARKGLCPVCETERLVLESYLCWLPANLGDAAFCLELKAARGYCGKHLALAMEALRPFPYAQVRLLSLLENVLAEEEVPFSSRCHLCASLEGSRRACLAACREAAASGGRLGCGEPQASFCPRHRSPAGKPALDGVAKKAAPRDGAEEAASSAALSFRKALLAALREVTRDYHAMGIDELRAGIDRCERMLREAASNPGSGLDVDGSGAEAIFPVSRRTP